MSFILFMYEISIYYLLKARLSVLKIVAYLSWICFFFMLFGFFRVDRDFFAYDYLANVIDCLVNAKRAGTLTYFRGVGYLCSSATYHQGRPTSNL